MPNFNMTVLVDVGDNLITVIEYLLNEIYRVITLTYLVYSNI